MITEIMVTPEIVHFIDEKGEHDTIELTHDERLLLNAFLVEHCDDIIAHEPKWHVRPLYFDESGYYAKMLDKPIIQVPMEKECAMFLGLD